MIPSLYWLDRNPVKAAQYHADDNLSKMIVESTILLSTCIHVANSRLHFKLNLHKPDINYIWNPSARWARQSRHNYMLTVRLAEALCQEYADRFKKMHACQPMIERISASSAANHIPNIPAIEIVQNFPQYLHQPDPVEGYRIVYAMKGRLWIKSKHGIPPWLKEAKSRLKHPSIRDYIDKLNESDLF